MNSGEFDKRPSDIVPRFEEGQLQIRWCKMEAAPCAVDAYAVTWRCCDTLAADSESFEQGVSGTWELCAPSGCGGLLMCVILETRWNRTSNG